MRRLIIIFTLLQFYITYSQVNYCGNCETFRNDNPEKYKNILSIDLKEYEGSPVFDDLNEESKFQLLDEEIKAQYNENGKLINYSHESLVSTRYTFKYDSLGLIISSVSREGSFDIKETYKYDLEKNFVTQIKYNYDGVQVDRIIKYQLNDKGKTLNRKEYFGNGVLLQEDSFKYDIHNNEIYSVYFGVKTNTSYKYDLNNNIIYERRTNNYGKAFTTTYKYNTEGKVIEIIRKSDENGLQSKQTFIYKNNLLIKTSEINYSNGKIFNTEITEYHYDSHGMWIKEMFSRNDILAKIAIREIKYRN